MIENEISSEIIKNSYRQLFRHASQLTWDTAEHNMVRAAKYGITKDTTSITIPNVTIEYVDKQGEIRTYQAESIAAALIHNGLLCEALDHSLCPQEEYAIRLSVMHQGEEYVHDFNLAQLKYQGCPFKRLLVYLTDSTDETKSTVLTFIDEITCQYLNVFIYIVIVNNLFLNEPETKNISDTETKNFVRLFEELYSKITKSGDQYKEICTDIDLFFDSTNRKLNNLEGYLDHSFAKETKRNGLTLIERIDNAPKGILMRAKFSDKRTELEKYLKEIDTKISYHNNCIARREIDRARNVIGKVEGRKLDDQQMQCIIKPMRNHLVVAGAGTGKTTTIVGKVKYLLKTTECSPKDILVVSFTNASAEEMRKRLKSETNEEIEASTFHKLGLNILTEVAGVKPKISDLDLRKFVRDRLKMHMRDFAYFELLCDYILYNHKDEKADDCFRTEEEYNEYLNSNPPITLKGEAVKSYGELDIANFLYRNGIKYEYEQEYEVDTRTAEKAQYRPDFHLSESGIYIEYFGIDREGHVPSFFTSKTGRSPSEEYQMGMAWKRKVHNSNGTILVESYAYERADGILLKNLERNLKARGVSFQPLSQEELWEKIENSNNSKNLLSGIEELISTVIALIKSNNYTYDTVRRLHGERVGIGGSRILLDIIEPIYDDYQNELISKDEIDFEDMINKATQMVRDGKYKNPYKYVIVDEYQDISKSRYMLLKALRDSMDYKLFCVGDDWQSIYRFAGSDLSYILNFSKHWGQAEISKIETTYRFNESLINISGNFVMQNPAQIRKRLKSGQRSSKGFALAEIKAYTEEHAINFMTMRLLELPVNSTVYFIGRYNTDQEILKKWGNMQFMYDNVAGLAKVIWNRRRDLDITFMTAHKSKGLQADYVFIINNKDRGLGFPSKIQDDPLVGILLEEKETYPYAEERRLFYVAMTRSRVKTFLLVLDNNMSEFVSEIEDMYEDELKKEAFTCPVCGGRLVKRSGQYGDFWGCSNYSRTGCKFTRNIGRKN